MEFGQITNQWSMLRFVLFIESCEPRDGESGIGREEVNMTTGIRKPAPAANMWGVFSELGNINKD